MSGARGITLSAGEARSFRACSACAGDYENPEVSAWDPEQTDDEGDGPDAGGEPLACRAEGFSGAGMTRDRNGGGACGERMVESATDVVRPGNGTCCAK